MKTNKQERFQQQIEREIDKATSKFNEHLLSNSKWVRLINALVENSELLKSIKFKKVQGEAIGDLFIYEDTTFGFDYWENGFEGHNSLGGWLTFKEIEYLFFPLKLDNETQDLNKIKTVINSVGEFCLSENSKGLKLICYR